jgi:hypothetical protein
MEKIMSNQNRDAALNHPSGSKTTSGLECPGCRITEGNISDDWGVRGHFSYVENEHCHLLNIIINCIDSAPQGAEIRVATCIWKDDIAPSMDVYDCKERKQNTQVDGQDVLCALQRALKRGCKISYTKPKDYKVDGQYKENEYNSPTMNEKLHNWDVDHNDVNYHWAGPSWNHFKGVMVSSMKVNDDVSKYLGLKKGNDQTVYDVTIVTSANLSHIDASKYQDMTLSWNWKKNKNDTPASFIYNTSVDFFDKLIAKNGPQANDKVLISENPNETGVGILLYPRYLPRGMSSKSDEDHSDYDPVVQFLRKFKEIKSIKIAMAYWQGNKGIFKAEKENKYKFRRIGITNEIIDRINSDDTDVSIVVNQLAGPVDGTNYYYNILDPIPQLSHYKENARSVPEFFKLRDAIKEKKNIDSISVPIKIVNNNRQQGTPYVHSKYMIVEGIPNDDMDESLKLGSKFIWVGSSNNDYYGAWNNAEITLIMDNQTAQGEVLIDHYKENFEGLLKLGRVFNEKTKIHGSKEGVDMTYDYYNDKDYKFGSRDIDNVPVA